MAKSVSELRQQLSDIEPDEVTYRDIGPAEVDSLRELLDDEDVWLGARAVHALSRIDSPDARDAVLSAAAHDRMEIRTAVASASSKLPPELSDSVLIRLLDDHNVGVRKVAAKSISRRNSEVVRRRIKDVAGRDPNARVREIAQNAARAFPPAG